MKTRSLASFLTRLIWLCMAPLLLLALWLSWDSLQKQEAKHRREGANLAHNFAASIDQHLRARISALNMLAISPLADDPRRWPELYAEAQGFRESFGLHVIFADHGRRMLFNTRQPYGAKLPHLPDSKGKTAAPLALETGQPQVGDIVIGPMAKIPLVAIAVPVLRPGKPTRLMLSIFETAQLQQRLDGLALPEGWSIALQDGTGADIARRSPAGFDAARDVDDDHRFVVRSELSPWSVRLEIPRDSHRDTYFVSFALLAAGLILATLLGVLGGTLASRRLGRQVQALAAPPGLALPPLRIAEIAAAHAQLMTAEADRRESEERYRRLFDLAPLSLALIADDGRVLMLNARFRTELGYTPEDLPNADAWFERAYPDPALRARAQTTWQRAAAGEDIDPRQYRVACKDGSERDMLISTVPQPEGKLAVFIDITEQKQAEQALAAALTEQNQARLATLNQMEDANTARRQAETSAERIRLLAGVVERIAAVHDFAALMNVVRPAVRRLTGADGATLVLNDNGCCFYADEDAIGPLWKGQRFPLESCISGWVMLHGEAAVIEDIYADERIPHEAYRPTFVKSLVMVPVGRNGPVAAIGAYWATQHKASAEEVELQQTLADAMSVGLANIDLIQNLERRVEERTTELAAANRELESFAYAVSHDLRAPLRAMSGFSLALQEDWGTQLTGEAKLYLDQIGIACRRMSELIDGLLTLSRSTRGGLRRESVDLSVLARRRLADLAATEPARQVAVTVEDGLVAEGDPHMLEAALGNLLDNAWKYTGRSDTPTIRVHRGEVDGREGFCVTDNGAGFDPAHAARLFQPFQRLHRQDEFPGIGIGLATVQRIVHRHGGDIVAHAVPGEGATFCFTLPEDGGMPDKETSS